MFYNVASSERYRPEDSQLTKLLYYIIKLFSIVLLLSDLENSNTPQFYIVITNRHCPI